MRAAERINTGIGIESSAFNLIDSLEATAQILVALDAKAGTVAVEQSSLGCRRSAAVDIIAVQ